METKNYEKKYNICVVGNASVGKTSYIKQLLDEAFMITYKKTSGIETHQIQKKIKGKNYLFKIWDLSGTTKPFNISNDLYRTVEGFIFTYAINDQTSFEEIQEWIYYTASKKVLMENSLLLGLKSDLEEESVVDLGNVKKTCEDYDLDFFLVSSKNKTNVKESFNKIVNKILIRNSCASDGYSFNEKESVSNSNCVLI